MDQEKEQEDNTLQTGDAIDRLLNCIGASMEAYNRLIGLEPNMAVGSTGSFVTTLESYGAEFAARWRFHQDTGSW